ncbi:hypothetical protein [Catenulispora sp. MAP5-51]|uniref:hypothetical protein n=1 Tax=Catenulispora sp. MAP5-51 TaxID=3156298 RepID=UPI003515B0E8
MRCYLVVEYRCDLSALHDALSDANVEVITPDHAFHMPPSDATGYWLPDVDFVLVVFPARPDWETPPALLLDVGVAIGKGVPVLVIAEPPRKLDAALAPLPLARVPLGHKTALSTRINQFASAIFGGSRPVGDDAPAVDHRILDSVTLDLEVLREQPFDARRAAHQFSEIAMRLLRACGAEIEESRVDGGFDAAGWVPGTETLFPEPLFFEFRLLRRAEVPREKLDQLAGIAARRGGGFGVLIAFPLDSRPVPWPENTWPMVLTFEMTELINELRQQSLATVLRNRRNAVVHGVGAR